MKAVKTLSQKQILILITVIAVAAAGFLVWDWKFRTDYDAFEFVGRIEKIENNTISLLGVYVVPDHPELSSQGRQKNVEVLVSADTEFTRTKLFLPTAEELKATGGRYTPADLKKEDEAGSLEDIKEISENSQGFSIRVKSQKDIYGKSKFSASEISYIVPVYP